MKGGSGGGVGLGRAAAAVVGLWRKRGTKKGPRVKGGRGQRREARRVSEHKFSGKKRRRSVSGVDIKTTTEKNLPEAEAKHPPSIGGITRHGGGLPALPLPSTLTPSR